jgi:hypothetical protein
MRDEPTAAFNRYREQQEGLRAARKPRPKTPDAAHLRELPNAFRGTQESRFKNNQITHATYHDHLRIGDMTGNSKLNLKSAKRVSRHLIQEQDSAG